MNSRRCLRHAAFSMILACTSAAALADSPARENPYSKAVGDRGEHVFVMLPGYRQRQRRTVPVSCAATESASGKSDQAGAASPQPDAASVCAANEGYSGGTRVGANDEVCEVHCDSYRRDAGGLRIHRRKVPVSCDAYEALFKPSQRVNAVEPPSGSQSLCAPDEKYGGRSSSGKRCEVYCESYRWEVRRSGKDDESAGYAASGLYHSGDRTKPLWTVQWYAHTVYLSGDGRYLVRMGPWASGADDLAVAFYDRGRLIKQYSVQDLVADTESLPRSVSHFQWRREVEFDEANQQLLLATLNDEAYVFDITSGKAVLQQSPPAPSYTAAVTGRDGNTLVLSNATLCGGIWATLAHMQTGRSAAFAFYGFIVKDSKNLDKDATIRTIETFTVPFSAIRTINHIGHDVADKHDLWLIEPKSGPAITLTTEIGSFGFCGDIGARSGEMIRGDDVKVIAFE